MNLTAYLGVDTSKWQDGWKQAESQSDSAFSKITAQMERTDRSVKRLENSMKSARERLSEKLTALGATTEQQAQILARFDYGEKLKQQAAATKALQAAEQSRIATLKNLATVAKTAFVGMFAVGGVRGLVDMADGYNQVAATIKNATNSTAEFEYFQAAAQRIAQATYKSYADVASTITALVPPIKTLGFSSKTTADFVETLEAAFRANGFKNGQGVITALAKSFNKGAIDGKAFQQALLAVPDLAANIAKQLGKTEAEVKALGVAGKLSANEFVKAVQASKGIYNEQAANVVLSIKDGVQYLKNALTQYIGETNNANGVTAKFASGLKFLGDNIGTVVKVLSVMAGIKVAGYIATATAAIYTQANAVFQSTINLAKETASVTANTAAWAKNAIIRKANSVGIAATGVNAAGAAVANSAGALAGLGNLKGAFSGIAKTLGKGGILAAIAAVIALTGEWQNTTASVAYIFNDLSTAAKSAYSAISQWVSTAWAGLKQFIDNKGIFGDFFKEMDGGIFGVFETIGKIADNVVAGAKAVTTVFINNLINSFKSAYNIIAKPIYGLFDGIEKGFNKVINGYNSIAPKLKLPTIDYQVDFSAIKEKLQFDLKMEGVTDLKSLFSAYQEEQKQGGLQAYFQQMAADIKQNQSLAEQEAAHRKAMIDDLDKSNDAFADIAETATGIA